MNRLLDTIIFLFKLIYSRVICDIFCFKVISLKLVARLEKVIAYLVDRERFRSLLQHPIQLVFHLLRRQNFVAKLRTISSIKKLVLKGESTKGRSTVNSGQESRAVNKCWRCPGIKHMIVRSLFNTLKFWFVAHLHLNNHQAHNSTANFAHLGVNVYFLKTLFDHITMFEKNTLLKTVSQLRMSKCQTLIGYIWK